MLFGLCTSDNARIAAARAWGYDYVEIGASAVVPLQDDASWHPRRRALLDAGTPVTHLAGFIPGEARFVGPDGDFERLAAYLETCVGRAAELGVRVFNWGSSASRSIPAGWSPARAYEQIERAAHLIADVTARHGCTCVIEPINPRECNAIYYVADALALARLVDRPTMRVLVDYFHVALQNEPLESIHEAREWLAHAHTSGPRRHFPKPTDGWDHSAYLAALRGAGYDRTLSFECSRMPEGAAFDEEAKVSLAWVKRLWSEV